MAISISAYYPESELQVSEFNTELTRIAMALAKFNNATAQPSKPDIELRFLLSGTEETPGFEGMRIGHFDANNAHLLLESAVPLKFNHSINAEKYITAALTDTMENTGEFLAELKINFDTTGHIRLAESAFKHA